MKWKWIIIPILILCALPLLAIGGAAAWLMTADLRPLLQRKLSEGLDRPVTIGSFQVKWGSPLTVEVRDLKIANPGWAKAPDGLPNDMITLGHAFARIDVMPLLHGTLRYQRLDIEKLVVVLERNPQGVGNWKFGADATKTAKADTGGGSGGPGGALIPKNRQQVPTLLDFTLSGSEIRYRTSSGRWLAITLNDVAINTDGDDQPITVSGEGAYNGIPAKLQAGADSFVKLRRADVPFGLSFSLTNESSAINFNGTTMQPLDFDGVKGPMTIDTKKLGALLKAFDAETRADLPLTLNGAFARSGNHWSLDQAKGALADNAFTGSFSLDEGPRGGTDHMAAALDFPRLDLDSVLGKIGAGGGFDPKTSKLNLPGQTSPAIKARLSAHRLLFHGIELPEAALDGAVAPGQIAIEDLHFGFAGSTLKAKGSARETGGTAVVAAAADLIGANLTDLLKTFGISTNDIAGKVDARLDLTGSGTTADQLLADSQGAAVLSMREGKVSRDVLEKASTDLRTLFRKGKGMSPVDCLLGVARIKNGVATLSPLALKSEDAQLYGAGTLDLTKRTVNLTIRSNPKSTGFFALDIPIHVSGPLTGISAKPAAKSELKKKPPLPELSPAMRDLAAGSGCAG